MTTENKRWIKLANHPDEIEFGTNSIAVMDLQERKICLAKFNDEIFAFSSVCPHAGGFLGDGSINEKGHVVCPVHQYRFNIRTGYNVSGEGYTLKRWPVVVRKDGLFVEVVIS